jgi:hypothetical protein
VNPEARRIAVLAWIKLAHTVVWFFIAGCVIAIPVAGAMHEFRWAAVLTSVVLLECAVLAVNRGRCPLTDVAGRYTEVRADNFDIYLPVWLARNNKALFGTLFMVGELFVLWKWFARV